jgi:quercetin dioxygenase-like cupin family protein
MKLQRNGTIPSRKGAPENFTGNVRLDSFFQAAEPGRAGGAIVTFEPGARTHWHTHPLGWTQCDGDPKVEIRAGDIIWCPCQRRHWHGATATTAMTHVAIAESLNGKAVEWMEPVTDSQYLAEARRD